jgi:signal transduction histidine kinase
VRSAGPPARDLRAYAAALISAASRREIARAFAASGLAAAGARGGSLSVVRSGALHFVAVSGAEGGEGVASLSASCALTEVFKTLEPAWLGSLAEAMGSFPAVGELLRSNGDQAWAALPLPGESAPLGVLSLHFEAPQPFDEEQRGYLGELAALTARALGREELQRRDKDARAFQHRLIGIAGHELRNPLTVVLASAEHLSRAAQGDRDKRAAGRLLRNSRRMDRVVRDLVDYAQAEAEGRLHIAVREVDFHDLCVRVLASLSSVHPERPVTYRRGEEGRGNWDPDRLEQLLENLLINALKYGAPDRPVYVGWYGDGAELVLKVHNHGPPIPAALLPYLFDPFQRGEEHGIRDGLGLGLYVVQQIARAHGGNVEVRSDRETGTTFVVRLPYAAPRAETHDLAS